MLQLALSTPTGGLSLGLAIELTGNVDYYVGGVTLAAVEVRIAAHCVKLTATGIEELPGSCVWVRPDDLRHGCGSHVSNSELIAFVERARQRMQDDMQHGPLGENWP